MSSPQAEKPLWELGRQTNFARRMLLPQKEVVAFFKSRLVDVAGGTPVTGAEQLCGGLRYREMVEKWGPS